MFDPYEKWLGIPKGRRPLTHYQLLDISRTERDPDVIEDAVAEQEERVRRHEEGPHAEACARLLKEIARARATLLDPARRKEYDAGLRKPAAREEEEEDEAIEAVSDRPTAKGNGKGNRKAGSREPARRKQPAKQGSSLWLWLSLAGAGVVVLLVGGVATAYLMLKRAPEAAPAPVALTPAPKPEPAPKPTEKPKEPAPAPAPAPAPVVQPPPAPTPPPPAPAVAPPAPKPVVKVVKLPVPDQAAQSKAEKALKDTYKAEYAKQKPEDRLALAALLFQPGRENRKDPADWFVILRETRDLALQAGRPRLAMAAIDEIDQYFLIDAPEMKLQALNRLLPPANEAMARFLVQAVLAQVTVALTEDHYDFAFRLLDLADTVVATPKGKTPSKAEVKDAALVKDRREEVQALHKEYQAATLARETLKQTPDDPAANLALGRYLCYFHGKWDEGLPHLAKGSDPRLKAEATADLANPPDPVGQKAVGDSWWLHGRQYKGAKAYNLLERAMIWYERADPSANEADKAEIRKRIEAAQTTIAQRSTWLPLGSFYGRDIEDKALLLHEGGGNQRSEEAVARGLEWLAQHQSASGGWYTDDFPKSGKCNCGGVGGKYDIAGTAFGLLPFLGAGYIPGEGKYATTVQKGLAYLLKHQKTDGNFSDSAYENALATTAVCEAYGLTHAKILKVPAQNAVNYIVRAQSSNGSWGYSAPNKGDLSVTGWQFTALKTAFYAGLNVPLGVFDKATAFINSVADPSGVGYGYNAPGAAPSTSATGLLCREFLGWGPHHPLLTRGVNQLALPQNLPVSKEQSPLYFVYYSTQVMHHFGGKTWETWNPKVRDFLLDTQDQGTDPKFAHQKGSWTPPDGEYGKTGGRIMYTALAVITLEVYYYSVPLNGYGPAVWID
jgi:hypothetical protein